MSSTDSDSDSESSSSDCNDWETEDETESSDENSDEEIILPRPQVTHWQKQVAFNPNRPPFESQMRISNSITSQLSPFQVYKYFVNDVMVNEIVGQTNLYVEQTKAKFPKKFTKWTPLVPSDYWKFTALAFLMGIVKKPKIKDYWSTDSFSETLFFKKVMSRNRFVQILSALHFVDNEFNVNLAEDRFTKLGSFMESLNSNFKNCVTPGEYLCVDESLMSFKGRLSFRQYVPLKRARFGIKLFSVVDCESGIVMKILPYQGKKTKINVSKEVYGLGGAVVLTLLEDYINKRHRVVIDNYFVSVKLASDLILKGTYILGTLRKNRKNLPVLAGKLTKGSVETYTKDGVMIERWQDRRQVLILNTFISHEMEEVITSNPTNTRQKPKTVLVYNKQMGAVDLVDKQIKPYESIRKTRKWYRKFYFHMMDVAMHNSFKAFQNKHPGLTLSYLEFIRSILGEIIAYFPTTQPKKGRRLSIAVEKHQRLNGVHLPEKVVDNNGKSRFQDCSYCRMSQKRKMTSFQCSECKIRLCIDGKENCFKKFHTDTVLPKRRRNSY